MPVVDPPLTGRDVELERVRAAVVDQRRSVVIAGRTGVGKSRLGREALDVCRAAGFTVCRVTATRASSGIPLGVFAPWLSRGSAEIAGRDDRAALLRRCAERLMEHAPRGRLVLGVDDAHHLDAMSATLVQQIAESGDVLVIASIRSGEPVPDPVGALWRNGHAERVELGALSEPAVAEVLVSTLGNRVDDAAVAAFAARSRGNVLFLVELVAGALADGALRDDGGLWRLVGDLRPTDRLVELVEERLEGLGAAERELLEVVALGEPLGLDQLARLGDEAVAERLERKALLTMSPHRSGLVIGLGHPVYGDVLRQRMGKLRARAVTRALAESVETTTDSDGDDLLRVAAWRLTGGGAEPALMYSAAVEARWRFDFRFAEQLARAAVDGGSGTSAAVLAAQLAGLQGRSAQADRELEDVAGRATTADERGRIALVRLDNRVIYAGTIDEGLRVAAAAEHELPDGELRDEIAARRAALLLAKDGPRRAMEELEPLLARATGRALAWACMPGAYSLARMGRIAEALDASRRGHVTQSGLDVRTDWYLCMHRFYETEALHHAGRFVEAEDVAVACYRDGVASGSLEQQALFSWQLAKPVADRGHVREAAQRARQAFGIYRQLDRGQFVDFCCIYRAQALALAGRYDDARSALRDLDRLGVGPSYFMGVDLTSTRGWVDVAGGHVRRGMERFLEAADQGRRIGDLVGALAALHSAARVGYATGVRQAVDEVSDSVEGALAAARVAHVHALAEQSPAASETASEAFEELGASLLAAEAAADAAVCWSRTDEGRRRVAAERRAAYLTLRCEGATTPALQAMGSRAHLTPAERETARLAASGLSNRDIATELVVSVRTVENRLQNVYGKLGVRSRSALADELLAAVAPDSAPR